MQVEVHFFIFVTGTLLGCTCAFHIPVSHYFMSRQNTFTTNNNSRRPGKTNTGAVRARDGPISKSLRSLLTSLNVQTSSWEHGPPVISKPYTSRLLMEDDKMQSKLLNKLESVDHQSNDVKSDMTADNNHVDFDPLWEQIKMEAEYTLETDPSAVSDDIQTNKLIHSLAPRFQEENALILRLFTFHF